jgi:flagellin
MSRINTNVSSIVARNNLAKSNTELAASLKRLSTGLKINRGADDPAGLIVSERLRTDIASLDKSISNAERASNVIATTESALQEINSLLTSIKGLVVESANTGAFSKAEIEANQLQIDSAIDSITRISGTTKFADLQLLNGSLDYISSGITASAISDVSIYGVNFGDDTTFPVTVEVINSAEHAQLFLSGGSGTPTIPSAVTLEIRGLVGVEVIQLGSGQSFTSVVQAVNRTKSVTGISASIYNTSGLVFTSVAFGSDSFVSVQKIHGQGGGEFFNPVDELDGNATLRDVGEDVLALINGTLAIGDGTRIGIRTSALQLDMILTDEAAQTTGVAGTHSFSINGGGALYQIGPDVNSGHQVGFGIPSVAANRLGNAVVGFLNSIKSGGDNSLIEGQSAQADQIIDAAIDQISTLRGRLGSFERNTLQTTIRSQQIALENITAAESRIRDTDFAQETANLTRAQILQQAGTSTLAIANSSAQNVLSLLG